MSTATFWLGQSTLFELTASAQWEPVQAWETDQETGKRRPSDRQQVDAAGVPVWQIRVIGRQDTYGRAEEVFLSLRVASSTKPEREALTACGVAA